MNEKTYKIKGLVWKTRYQEKDKESYFAETHFSDYYVQRDKKEFFSLWYGGFSITCKSIEDGKEKAEAHWLAQILPALEEVKEGA